MPSLQLAEYRRCRPGDPAAAMEDPNCHVLARNDSNSDVELCFVVLYLGLILGLSCGFVSADSFREQPAAAMPIEPASAQADEQIYIPLTASPEQQVVEVIEDVTISVEQLSRTQEVSASGPPLLGNTRQDHGVNAVVSHADQDPISDANRNINAAFEDGSGIQPDSTPIRQLTDDSLGMLMPQKMTGGVPSVSNVPSLGTITTQTTATNRAVTPPAVDTALMDSAFVFDLELQEAPDISPGDWQWDGSPPKDRELEFLDNMTLFESEGPMTDES